MRRIAFTLSEVLITLGVIGVVAAMTLPTVIKEYQKIQTVNKLKETYSLLSQAFGQAISDHDAPVNWTYDDNNLDLFVQNYLAPYVKIVNKTTTAPKHYSLRGDELNTNYYKNRMHYYLANGVELTLDLYSNTHIMFTVDINGTKGPNKMGKDCFRFQFSKAENALSASKIFSFNGVNNNISSIKSECNKNKSGFYCGAWIYREGWKIPKDYPW